MPTLVRPVAPDPYDLLPAVPAFSLTSDDITEGRPLDTLSRPSQRRWREPEPSAALERVPVRDPGVHRHLLRPRRPDRLGFWHWVLVGVPVTVTELARGAGAANAPLPPGVLSRAQRLRQPRLRRGRAASRRPPPPLHLRGARGRHRQPRAGPAGIPRGGRVHARLPHPRQSHPPRHLPALRERPGSGQRRTGLRGAARIVAAPRRTGSGRRPGGAPHPSGASPVGRRAARRMPRTSPPTWGPGSSSPSP